jgi:hypothetical protein
LDQYSGATNDVDITGTQNDWGDPLMVLAAPAGQYLDRYVFATDAKFDFAYDYAVVIRPKGATVELECLGVLSDEDFTQVGNSEYEVGRFALDYSGTDAAGCVDGPQLLVSDKPVGLSVIGFDSRNSYGYLGGVGVRAINPIVIVV